ncbi:MAG: DUF5615 family PIN-like protein [Haloarculaceae archaeon]
MQILADANVPEEYVAALRGDGHDVRYSRDIDTLGPEATDDAITEFAESKAWAVLSTDMKDFAGLEVPVPVLVAPQGMSGGEVRTAVARIEAMPFDPAETEPLWLSTV